jgi:hypothetical protein
MKMGKYDMKVPKIKFFEGFDVVLRRETWAANFGMGDLVGRMVI